MQNRIFERIKIGIISFFFISQPFLTVLIDFHFRFIILQPRFGKERIAFNILPASFFFYYAPISFIPDLYSTIHWIICKLFRTAVNKPPVILTIGSSKGRCKYCACCLAGMLAVILCVIIGGMLFPYPLHASCIIKW